MSELRERLATKRRRRLTVSVAIEDPAEAVSAVNRAQVELMRVRAVEPAEAVEEQQRVVDEAKAVLTACYVDVQFEACKPADFEALQTDFTAKDGGIDPVKVSEHLPPMIVACVVEDDLRDEGFWREQLDSGTWSYGERVNLANRLIGLNVAAPDERIPFG